MPALDAVLLRVEKLLALATSSNVHEAALAASRAQALIAEYRLEELLAERAAVEVEVGQEVLESARRPRVWRAVLAQALAESNGCLVFSADNGREVELRLVGREEDRAITRMLFSALAPRLEWLSATHGPGRDRAWHEAFRVGAAEAVAARLHADEPASDTALQRDHTRRHDAVASWADRNLRLGKGRGLRLDSRGYAKGKAAGAEVALPRKG